MFVAFLWALIKVSFFSFLLSVLILQSNNLIVVFLRKPLLWILTMFALSYGSFYLSSLLFVNVGLVLWIVLIAYLYTNRRSNSIYFKQIVDEFYEDLGISNGRIKRKIAYWFYIIGAVLGWVNFYGVYRNSTAGETLKFFYLTYIRNIPIKYLNVLISVLLIMSLVIYLLNSYEKNSRKINIKLIRNFLITKVSVLLGVLAMYYFKEPNAKLLKRMSSSKSKWRRDDTEQYWRKLEGFFSLESFDLNWLAGLLVFVISFAVISFLWMNKERLSNVYN